MKLVYPFTPRHPQGLAGDGMMGDGGKLFGCAGEREEVSKIHKALQGQMSCA